VRFPMPAVQHLENTLRHVSAQSLFVRGLIPIETGPVLKRLIRLDMHLSQIYFLWCDFDPYAADLLMNFFKSNLHSLTDLGFEVCTPPVIISDQLIHANLPHLSSIRVWQENGCGDGTHYAISDQSLLDLADLIQTGSFRLETIDLSNAKVTVTGVVRLIEAWWNRGVELQELERSYESDDEYNNLARFDLSIGFHNCSLLTRADIVNQCNAIGIPLSNRGFQMRNGFRLAMHVT